MTEVAPTTAQLVARAEKAEKDLESTLKASEHLARSVQHTIEMLRIINSNNGFEGTESTRLVAFFLRDALDRFDTWDLIPV